MSYRTYVRSEYSERGMKMTFKEVFDTLVSYANKMNLSAYCEIILSRHAFYYYEKALNSMGYYVNDDAVRNMKELFEDTCVNYQRHALENMSNDEYSIEKESNILYNAVRVFWLLHEVEKTVINKYYVSPILANPFDK